MRHRDLKMFVPPLADLAAMGAKVKELQEALAELDGRAALTQNLSLREPPGLE